MDSKILILSEEYPSFLVTELKYLEDLNLKYQYFYIQKSRHLYKEENITKLIISPLSLGSRISIFLRSLQYVFSEPKTYKKIIFNLKNAYRWLILAQIYMKQIERNNVITKDTLIYSYWSSELGLAAALLQKKYGCKLIVRMHGWDLYAERHGLNVLPFRDLINNYSNRIFFISNQGLKYYSDKYPAYSSKFYVNYLGISNNNAKLIQKNEEVFHIVSCSYAFRVKRLEVICESILKLKSIGENVFWTHIGDGKEMKTIENQIEFLGLKDSVRLIKNFNNTDILNYYGVNYKDVFINASLSEGIPISMMEAMSFGIPCIGPKVGGIPEIIEDGKNGFLLPECPSADELANGILKFKALSDNSKDILRKNAFQTWKNKFDAEKNAKEFIDEILSL